MLLFTSLNFMIPSLNLLYRGLKLGWLGSGPREMNKCGGVVVMSTTDENTRTYAWQFSDTFTWA